MKIEVSNGEIIDKLSIIRIKIRHITDQAKLDNLTKEQTELQAASTLIDCTNRMYFDLSNVNDQLWDAEERIRDLEARGDFGYDFIQTARSIYKLNDERSAFKRIINEATNSDFVEEKSYTQF